MTGKKKLYFLFSYLYKHEKTKTISKIKIATCFYEVISVEYIKGSCNFFCTLIIGSFLRPGIKSFIFWTSILTPHCLKHDKNSVSNCWIKLIFQNEMIKIFLGSIELFQRAGKQIRHILWQFGESLQNTEFNIVHGNSF